MNTIKKPEIHDAVLKLIDTVLQDHQAGSAHLSLLELVESFPAELSDADKQRLAQRGDLDLAKTSADGGTFQNQGQAINLDEDGVKVTVPAVIQGTYEVGADSFRLLFDGGHTITGSKKFGPISLSAKLLTVSVDQQEIFLHTNHSQVDTKVIHESG